MKERVIEELAAAEGLDKLAAVVVLPLRNADFPGIIVKPFHPLCRIDAIPASFACTKRLEEAYHVRDHGDVELLRLRYIDASYADIKGELCSVAVNRAHQLRFSLGRIREPRHLLAAYRVNVWTAGLLAHRFYNLLPFVSPRVRPAFFIASRTGLAARRGAVPFAIVRADDELKPDVLHLPDRTHKLYKV